MPTNDFLEDGFKYRVGRGDIYLFFEKWLDEGLLFNQVELVHENNSHLCTKDVLVNSEWRWDVMHTQLSQDIKQIMINIILDINTKDKIIWSYYSIGCYTANSAFQSLIYEPANNSSLLGNWSCVWKTSLPEHIKLFLWLAFHESMSINLFRLKRHVAIVCSCYRCEALEESLLHMLQDRPIVINIWRKLNLVSVIDFNIQNKI
uniref:Ribonuclease H protein At1g65750 family n=1 Tax=Cajanus cajan TaxID=3821 RepID=A0A151U6D6_CAJCA|nr:Putative ribonuclease H protein At1g65750 family [Cajanus cajan]